VHREHWAAKEKKNRNESKGRKNILRLQQSPSKKDDKDVFAEVMSRFNGGDVGPRGEVFRDNKKKLDHPSKIGGGAGLEELCVWRVSPAPVTGTALPGGKKRRRPAATWL